MADAEAVCQRIRRKDGVMYSALVLNLKGLERAHAAGITHVDMGLSASETHSHKNVNMSVAEAMSQLGKMIVRAQAWGLSVRAGVQCAYEGAVDARKVIALARRILTLGVQELSLADSTGMANPQQVWRMTQELQPIAAPVPLVLHLHDTRGMGLANLLSALQSGVTHFDTSFGGLGGCPFIKGATGNIATEDTLHMLHTMGVMTGIDAAKVAACAQAMEGVLGRRLEGKMYKLMSKK